MAIASANCPIAIRKPVLADGREELFVAADEVGDARRQQQAREHPAERADEELLDERRRRPDAELRRGLGDGLRRHAAGLGVSAHGSLLSGETVRRAAAGPRGPGHGRRLRLCLFGHAGQDPEQVGEPVQVGKDVAGGDALVGRGQRDGPPLGAPGDGPGQLERGGQPALARDHELLRELDRAFRRAQHLVEAVDHLARDARDAVLLLRASVGVGRELRADREQLALEPQQQLAEAADVGRQDAVLRLHAELGAREAEGRDGLVDRAVGLGPQVVLADAVAAEQEPGAAIVAAAGRHGAVERERGTRHPRSALTTSGPRRAGPSARPAA